jgi:acyl carrier protein
VENSAHYHQISQKAILSALIAILEDMTSEWDTDFESAIGPNTRLIADLAFESIDIVQFIVAIEESFKRRGLPYEEFLMTDGRYVDEIKVGDIVAFLNRHLNNE